ncbi:hypothetical protein [Streptomyces sp. NPDC001292]|uniref:hypothetical protein n=1 Tax=Streptomyces sp. NPDC001292 TaxID=3364558 RepID=UPI0036BBDE91
MAVTDGAEADSAKRRCRRHVVPPDRGQSSDDLRQLADEIVDIVVGGLILGPVR